MEVLSPKHLHEEQNLGLFIRKNVNQNEYIFNIILQITNINH